MDKTPVYLAIDAGNSRLKAGWFASQNLIKKVEFSMDETNTLNELILSGPALSACIIGSVSASGREIATQIPKGVRLLHASHELKINFNNKYLSPATLGIDRLAAMCAASALHAESAILVIDAGTCITYDILTAEKNYEGGAISPGLQMRYRALGTFTGKLPLLSAPDKPMLGYGKSTAESLHAGVCYSILLEMEGWIACMQREFGVLKVVITGGDGIYFAPHLKYANFAEPDFVLKGLHELLILNL